jgi:starvation-inducible DNA-binding protein
MNFKHFILLVTIVTSYSSKIFSVEENDVYNEKRGKNMISLGLSEKDRKNIAEKLNILLANEYLLYTKTLKYHWNVKGKHFGPLHALFREQYEALFKFIDDIAERSLALGFDADGSLEIFAKKATITENNGKNPEAEQMIENLLKDHETIIQQIRTDIVLSAELNDWGTNNFLSDLVMKHEKIAWMLRAHLQH